MESGETHTNPEHATMSLKVLLLIFAVVLIATLGWLVRDYKITTDNTDNSINIAITKKAKKEAKVKTNNDGSVNVSGWKTYTSANKSYSFLYPANVRDGGTSYDNYSDLLRLTFQSFEANINDDNWPAYDNPPFYDYTREDIKNERAAIKGKDPTKAAAFGHGTLPSSYKIISEENFIGVSFIDLDTTGSYFNSGVNGVNGDYCWMGIINFSLKAHYYLSQDNNAFVEIFLNDNRVGEIVRANPEYFQDFSTTEQCPRGESPWKAGGQQKFYDDLVAGKTDTLTQNWYKIFQEVVASFKAS